MSTLKVKFGIVFDPHGDLDFTVKVAAEAERMGLDSILLTDHYMSDWSDEKYDVWPILAYLSAKTSKIRLGTAVTPIILRHPSVLAKLVLAVDVTSKGRAILGAGLGWNEKEFTAYGIGWDDFKTRVEKSREGIELILRLWSEEKANYSGRYYSLKDAIYLPKPVTRPHPPIWCGGNSKSILKLAANLGQGWIPARISLDTYREGVKTLESFITNRETREQFVYGYTGLAAVAKNIDDAKRMVPIDKTVHAIEPWKVGDPKTCVEIIRSYIEAGCNYVAPTFVAYERTLEQLELFVDEVIPAFE